MLLLAVHNIHQVTAKVPLSLIILLDYVKRKSLPTDLKCRVVLPSSGIMSISLWDAPSIEMLQEWLDENVNQDCENIVFEAQEEFSYGLSLELGRLRATEKVTSGGRTTLDRISQTTVKAVESAQQSFSNQLEALDQKTNFITATKETTSAAFIKVRTATAEVTDKVRENEKVSAALQNIQTGVQTGLNRANIALNWMGSKVRESFNLTPEAGSPISFPDHDPTFSHAHAADPYVAPPSYTAATRMPVSTPAGRVSLDTTSDVDSGWPVASHMQDPESNFTIQEDEPSTPEAPLPPAPAAALPDPFSGLVDLPPSQVPKPSSVVASAPHS